MILRIGEKGLQTIKWYVDASFVVHEDYCSRLGGVMTLSERGSVATSVSNKNT